MTQVVLPAVLLVRRADLVSLIGPALVALARGEPVRRTAREVGVPRSTVRGWAVRLRARAGRVRAHFTRWLVWLDGDLRLAPGGGPVADAVTAVVAAGLTAAGRGLASTVWTFVSAATGGRLLERNTSAPFPAPWDGRTLPGAARPASPDRKGT